MAGELDASAVLVWQASHKCNLQRFEESATEHKNQPLGSMCAQDLTSMFLKGRPTCVMTTFFGHVAPAYQYIPPSFPFLQYILLLTRVTGTTCVLRWPVLGRGSGTVLAQGSLTMLWSLTVSSSRSVFPSPRQLQEVEARRQPRPLTAPRAAADRTAPASAPRCNRVQYYLKPRRGVLSRHFPTCALCMSPSSYPPPPAPR